MDRRERGLHPGREAVEASGLLEVLECLSAGLGALHPGEDTLELPDQRRVETVLNRIAWGDYS